MSNSKAAKNTEMELANLAVKSAHECAESAFDEFVRSTPVQNGQMPYGECGWARVVVFAPPPKLRNALKTLGHICRDYNGAWMVSDFSKHAKGVAAQSYQAQRTVCEAACTALNAVYLGSPEFFVQSDLD